MPTSSSENEITPPPGEPPSERARMAILDVLPPAHRSPRVPFALALGALGVVYGDLGTNPLFALQECFGGSNALATSQQNVLGVLSLVFWALTFVISIKYLTFVMRASNDGEGGILALLALVPGKGRKIGRAERPTWLVLLVVFGAALLYGDGVVTPAISVLSAIEGLKLASPSTEALVVPITVLILICLFVAQRRGTEGIGNVFGPLMIVWFVAIGALGLRQIVAHPQVLGALDPRHAFSFFAREGKHAFLSLGAIVLCIAGGEALYADMGHFGKRPIAISWYVLVFPSLLLAYFGQGAYLVQLSAPLTTSTFYAIVPSGLLIPMVILSAMATVIASQALISGAYSLTHQAVQLGLFPRVNVVHTSEGHAGQIYVPSINTMLMVACVALVIGFGSSDKLAAAYGLAVTGTMSITSVAYFVVLTRTWGWPRWRAMLLVGFFLVFDLAFLGANLRKFLAGGWVPVGIAIIVFVVMTTWLSGRKRLGAQFASQMVPLAHFLEEIARARPHRVPGIAVFMTGNPGGTPPALRQHYEHAHVIHERVVLLSVLYEDAPFVVHETRVALDELGERVYRVTARFGFMETPNVPAVLRALGKHGLEIDPAAVSYYLGRETLIVSPSGGMARWRKKLFAIVSRNATSATMYFGIPPDRVVELRAQIEI